jgi:hypothetical protein
MIRSVAGAGPAIECWSVMLRNLFNFAAAASLVVCVAVMALWIRSACGADMYDRMTWDAQALTVRRDFVALYPGIITVYCYREQGDSPPNPAALARIRQGERPWGRFAPPSARPTRGDQIAPRPASDLLVYAVRSQEARSPTGRVLQRSVSVRLWPIALGACVLPGWWVSRKVRHAHRVRTGHCQLCGYDLRATPDRCPECGAVPKPPHNPPMQRTATASPGAVE